jgi:cytochrome d ubiquinol oxidase subunit II
METLITLPNLCALAVVVALTAYVVLAGADFGGGVWDLLASGPRKREQRELVAHAIGPIWEANHVWLILVVVLLFMCFPPAFALVMTYLNVPLVLMLIGIVLRGSAFVFRAYDVRGDGHDRTWGRTFAIASLITPILLGACIGAIASGALGDISSRSGVYDAYFAPWLAPFPLACGALALASFTFLAAVYLTLDARDELLREDFRTRALWSAAAVFVMAFGALDISRATAPRMDQALMRSSWALPFQLVTGVAALTAILSLWKRHWRVARIAAAAQVSLILWGWVASQYPTMIPGQLSIAEAAAPAITLRLALYALIAGGIVLFPSLWYLFRVFKSRDAV